MQKIKTLRIEYGFINKAEPTTKATNIIYVSSVELVKERGKFYEISGDIYEGGFATLDLAKARAEEIGKRENVEVQLREEGYCDLPLTGEEASERMRNYLVFYPLRKQVASEIYVAFVNGEISRKKAFEKLRSLGYNLETAKKAFEYLDALDSKISK